MATLARTQYGIFTRAQARAAGLSLPQIKRRVANGEWVAVDFGVYRLRATPASWEQRLLAACLAGPAVASHRSAARLWKLAGFEDAPVEVSAVRHLRRHAPDVIWHESRWLTEPDVLAVRGIPCTAAARTIVDLASVLDPEMLQQSLDDALRRHLVSAPQVLALVERFGPTRRGIGAARRAVTRRLDRRGPTESVLESRFDSLIRVAGLPAADRQHVVRQRDGTMIARVDFAYPEAHLAIEIDSVRHHAGVDDWRRDLDRQNRLLAVGWRILRFTAHDLERRSDWVVRVIRAALTV